MRIVKLTEETTQDILVNMLKRSPSQYGAYEDTVKDILEDVKTRGTKQYLHIRRNLTMQN